MPTVRSVVRFVEVTDQPELTDNACRRLLPNIMPALTLTLNLTCAKRPGRMYVRLFRLNRNNFSCPCSCLETHWPFLASCLDVYSLTDNYSSNRSCTAWITNTHPLIHAIMTISTNAWPANTARDIPSFSSPTVAIFPTCPRPLRSIDLRTISPSTLISRLPSQVSFQD